MTDLRMDFTLTEGVGQLWLASATFGGLTPAEFAQEMDQPQTAEALIAKGLVLPVPFSEASGFCVRLVTGELAAQEAAEWVARAKGRLSVPDGKLLVASQLSADTFPAELAAMTAARPGRSHPTGVWIAIEPGDYLIEIFNYLPSTLSGAWYGFAYPEFQGDEGNHEDLQAWFHRTRPGQQAPVWVENGGRDRAYLDFIIQLTPLEQKLVETKAEGDVHTDGYGYLQWEFRKPEICPLGLSFEYV